jgi:hypothetical protein
MTVDVSGFTDLVVGFYNELCDDTCEAMFDEMRQSPSTPKDTGQMVANLNFQVTESAPPVLERIMRAPEEYSSFQDEGTGVYGPEGTPIYPTHGKVLVFYWKKTGRVMFLPSVLGTPATGWWTNVVTLWPEYLRDLVHA